ncbi:TIGR04219 family outer membrane beta-barrel protein [Shewanella saliphila]|uniref:Outer membrane protein n=1 Tax=Shewanella saliphila TaxID=2282698 RepID=A0ABQ2QBM2_9GAMM|nr:TIGR04219 family outer membrane beta-barrel protein [Shewanella saliphila]MCL1103109.1 TIGR04219 family outer membrane beta-barrel protein [Shewanella saliphila]GGP65748.1 outer membrane protein [Shewanella saliphila]
MKKTLLATAVVGLLSMSSAHAATVVGFKVGADYWLADTTNSFNDDSGVSHNFDDDGSQGSVWIAVEHPLPFLPNLKIRENRLESSAGLSNVDFTFNDNAFSGDVSVTNNLNNTDFVLYYEILDNDLVSVDLGAAYKQMDGSIRVSDAGHPEEVDIDSGIIMGYANAQVGMVGLGLFGFADVLLGVDESNVYDYSVGLGWQFESLAVDTLVRVGYRDFNFDVSHFSGVSQNTQFKGAFAGIELRF